MQSLPVRKSLVHNNGWADACAAWLPVQPELTLLPGVQGSARVIRCLQDAREELGYECRATLFDQEVRMAEDIDFKYPMKRACTAEIGKFCAKIEHGHANIIRCLQVSLPLAAGHTLLCSSQAVPKAQHALAALAETDTSSTCCPLLQPSRLQQPALLQLASKICSPALHGRSTWTRRR